MIKLANNLKLPLDFITERIAFLARTGAGKSGGMRVMFEQIFDAGQFAIFVDPKGDAWGIRAAGVGKGKPVLVMGGDHGDVPLEATAGKVIAEFLVRERVSTVLDVSDFGKADMVRFVTDLCRTLYQRNRDVVHIFFDEADMVAGEKFYDPKCLEAIQLIQNKGRHRGFGVTLATQRSAMINKSVLFASGTLIAMQTTSPKDIAVVREWLEVCSTKEIAKEIVAVLPTLKTREAVVYSPQLLDEPVQITFDTFQTFDSMRTPKPGEARQQPKSVADIDLSAVQRDMAATIEKVKAEDPKRLQAENARLTRELAAASKHVCPAGAGETVEVPVLDEEKLDAVMLALIEYRREIREKSEAITETVQTALNELYSTVTSHYQLDVAIGALRHAEPTLPKSQNRTIPSPPAATKPAPANPNRRPVVRQQRPAGGTSDAVDVQISNPQQRLLDTLALFETFGVTEVKRSNLAALAGVSPRSSGFEKNLSTLRNHPDGGLVEYGVGSTVIFTERGRAAAREHELVIASNADLLNAWCGHVISNPQGVLLRILFDQYPDAITRDDLAAAAGVSVNSSGFEKNLSTMRSLGLIDYGPNKTVFATDLLFPFS